jgi:hypothetical protein
VNIKNYALLLALFISVSFHGQSQSLRGMYINNFDEILGNTQKEDSLLMYMQDSSFNYMALYNLSSLDYTNAADMNMLSAFILKARQTYQIPYVGAVGETLPFFTDNIKSYNNSRANQDEKLNVFNLEFEFWTTSSVEPGGYYCVKYLQQAGCSCDTAGAFNHYIRMLHSIDSLAATQGAISETYIGWFNEGQGREIQSSGVDRILLHAYRVDNSSVWGYSRTRMSYLAANNQMVNVAPIFSSEPIFMGPWLADHSLEDAFDKYETDFNADNASWKPYINLLGFQWFDWGYMPRTNSAGGNAPSISASGSTSFCPGGLVTLTATVGSSYLWNNGATTRSINVSGAGNYQCNVTQGGITQTSNTISVTVYNAPTVSVIVNVPVNSTVPLSSNAVAGSGNISSYQWELNSSNITGASTSEYVAVQSGDYSLVTTNSYGCSSSSTAAAVVVPVSSCMLVVPDGVYHDNLTAASATIHWDPLGTTDSIIIRYKVESFSTYTYIRLANTGQVSYQLEGLIPATEYSWRVKTVCGSSSGNYSTKKYFTTSAPTGVTETALQKHTDVMVYPNPATTSVHIAITCNQQTHADLVLTDVTGKTISDEHHLLEYGNTLIETDVSRFSKGIYILSLRTETENITRRISIE